MKWARRRLVERNDTVVAAVGHNPRGIEERNNEAAPAALTGSFVPTDPEGSG
jgi:hypothetical protein